MPINKIKIPWISTIVVGRTIDIDSNSGVLCIITSIQEEAFNQINALEDFNSGQRQKKGYSMHSMYYYSAQQALWFSVCVAGVSVSC